MTFGQLEDNVNTWLMELNQLEQEFKNQAQTINSWDSLLVNNAVKIFQINQSVEALKVENNRLDRQLDFIVEQQCEVEKVLEPLEKANLETVGNGERETTYSMVETVQNELHSISEDLQNFITKLNEVSSDENGSNPIEQIEQILNAQMDALQYVERHINSLTKTSLPI